MKLYYSPGACSLAVHIALRETGLPFELVAAPTRTHQLADGTDYHTINPLGYVPLLELADGTRLTEVPALLQYVADQAPARALAPANGTLARYQLQSRLGIVSTELHGRFGPLFSPTMPEEVKAAARARIAQRLAWVDAQLADGAGFGGKDYSVADIYLFVVTNWTRLTQIDLGPYQNLAALRERVGARAAVQEAMRAEGLIKAAA